MDSVKKTNIFAVLKWAIFLIVVLLLWYHMHIYRLSDTPFEVFIDEFGIGYDSWSLLNFGVDRWLMRYPVYLNNYDSGSSIAYTILCAISIKLFGNTSITALRFPAACVSLLSMVFLFLLLRKIEHKWLPFAGVLLFNLLPYFTMQSRVALDCNLMMCAMLSVTFFCNRALEKKNLTAWCLAGVACGIALYTYVLAWVVIPVTLVLFLLYALRIGELQWKKLAALAIPCAVLGLPLVLCAIINACGLDTIVIGGGITIPRLLQDRVSEFGFSNPLKSCKAFFDTIFVGDGLPVNCVYGFNTFFPLSVPFLATGMIITLVRAIRAVYRKEKNVLVTVQIVFLAELILAFSLGNTDGLGGSGINLNRINGIFGILLIELMVCFWQISLVISVIVQKIFKQNCRILAVIFFAAVIVLYIPSFLRWEEYYFRDKTPALFGFAAPVDEIVDRFGEELYTRSVHWDVNYAQVLLAMHISPYEFNAPSLEKSYTNMKRWRNMAFDLYGEFGVIEENALYVVYKEHEEFIEYFSGFPELSIYETPRYICFYN